VGSARSQCTLASGGFRQGLAVCPPHSQDAVDPCIVLGPAKKPAEPMTITAAKSHHGNFMTRLLFASGASPGVPHAGCGCRQGGPLPSYLEVFETMVKEFRPFTSPLSTGDGLLEYNFIVIGAFRVSSFKCERIQRSKKFRQPQLAPIRAGRPDPSITRLGLAHRSVPSGPAAPSPDAPARISPA
jgi:hypothetical protein